MPKRIIGDHNMFRDVISGKLRKELKERISHGTIFPLRPKGGKVGIPIPSIDLPHFRFGKPQQGVGSGPGKDGEVVGEEPGKGQGKGKGKGKGKGREAGEGHSEGMEVGIDLKDVINAMAEDLELPNLLPKPNDTFKEIKTVYNGISKIGPPALLHKRKTMYQCMKRMIAANELNNLQMVPGFAEPMPILTPITEDRRYRQWNEIKLPSSNAVIFYVRDYSGSMDQFKCDIIDDMAFWINCWISFHYENVQECYVLHDTQAKEVSKKKFFSNRMGGGTLCSSGFKYVAEQLKERFPPETWNIYLFYFSDGENFFDDDEKCVEIIRTDLNPNIVNLLGMTQILCYNYENSLKHSLDQQINNGSINNNYVRTTSIDRAENQGTPHFGYGWSQSMDDASRNMAIKNAIKDLLGRHSQKKTMNKETGYVSTK